VGEHGLLRSISRYLDPPSRSLLVAAPSDDAAVWRGDPFVVATTDTMVEEIDFRLQWPGFDFRTLGRRLMSINLSDLAAMGAEPRYALISLTLRGTLPVADVRRLYQGIAEQARRFSCAIAGGDVSGTLGLLTLTATLIGRLDSARSVLRREGARPGWLLAVTGSLGGAAAGLRLLESGRGPVTRNERAWVSAQLDPTPRIIAGRVLVESGVRVGGDISDGLHREVERLVEGTRLGATIDVERLPLARGLHRKEWALAVKNSEDFELICAAPAPRIAAASRVLERVNIPLTVVGEVEPRPGIRLRNGTHVEKLEGAGYEHFR
jgi:thiamine-monophosphate kinase